MSLDNDKYATTERTGGEALIDQLLEEGVQDIFGIPGVQLDWAVEPIRKNIDKLNYIVPRHEQATSYMADGYARTTGREGVCMVVPGPGMLNALSGIATAYACSAPVLFIVGQIDSRAIGKGHGLLHELPDQSGILERLTKWNGIATTPEEVPALVHEAFVQLRSGLPRPVALEVPPDVLQASGLSALLPRAEKAPTLPEPATIKEAAAILVEAKMPVIFAGGGSAASDAGEAIRELAEKIQAPVVMTENGRGVLDSRHPLALTGLGGRAVLPHSDAVLILGSRFLDALARPFPTAPGARLIYCNVDEAHTGTPREPGLVIPADVRQSVEALSSALSDHTKPSNHQKVADVQDWSNAQIAQVEPQASFVNAIRSSMADDDIVVSELTQVGYFSNIAFPSYGQRRFITPGYQGTLGYGFNTAMGAAYGNPDNRVISLNGDGGFGWGMQELATVSRDQCNISIVVFVDGHFGNVRRIQQRVFQEEFAVKLTNPDFITLAEAYNLSCYTADSPASLGEALMAARDKGGPALIAVSVEEMPSPWALIHSFVPNINPVPPNPLGEPVTTDKGSD